MRFQTVATRARYASSILEQGISQGDEFRLVHSVMIPCTAQVGTWVRTEWYNQYNVQAAALQ